MYSFVGSKEKIRKDAFQISSKFPSTSCNKKCYEFLESNYWFTLTLHLLTLSAIGRKKKCKLSLLLYCNIDSKFSYAQLLILLVKSDILKFLVIYRSSYKFVLL